MSSKEDKLYWHKKDGTRILIKDMDDKYLLQELNKMEANAKEKNPKAWKDKVDPMYHLLKMHALGRELIKK